MYKYKENLDSVSWEQLLQDISEILSVDMKKLEVNVNYYKKLFNNNNPDADKLNKIFERLQLDKLRFNYFSELIFRLDDSRYKFIILQLESCILQETEMQNRAPKDWAATVTYKDGQVSVYFMALSYYQ